MVLHLVIFLPDKGIYVRLFFSTRKDTTNLWSVRPIPFDFKLDIASIKEYTSFYFKRKFSAAFIQGSKGTNSLNIHLATKKEFCQKTLSTSL